MWRGHCKLYSDAGDFLFAGNGKLGRKILRFATQTDSLPVSKARRITLNLRSFGVSDGI
jgi:hypothetical protein